MGIKASSFSKLLAWAGPVLMVGGGAAAYLLSGVPFGPIFNTCLYLAVVGLIFTLAVYGVVLLTASARWKKPFGVVLSAVSYSILIAAVIVPLDYTLLPIIDVPKGLSREQWREDLDVLAREFPRLHPGLFDLVDENEFGEAVSNLRDNLDHMDEITIKGELAKIVALPDDAHSYPNIFSFSLDWHMYPINVYLFDDGLYVVDAARERKDLIGSRIVEVCGKPVDEVLTALEPYLSAENEYGLKSRNAGTITLAEWLYASGVAASVREADFLFENASGQRSLVRLKPVHYIPVSYWSFVRTVDNVSSPAVSNPRRDNYAFEYDEGTGTLYFQFNQVRNHEGGESLTGFTARLREFVDTHEFERFVVDVRNNDGGNGGLVPALVEFLAGSEKINRAGKLFVIIGRKTFSAAVMFAAMMDNNTKALFVGEPTSQGPNFCSGPDVLTLPNSKMQFMISRALTRGSLLADTRDRISPDIHTGYTWADFDAGRDPAMEAILAYRHNERVHAVLDQEILGRYTGRYLFDEFQVLTISNHNGRLCAEVTNFIKGSFQRLNTGLYPVSPKLFGTDVAGLQIGFARSEESGEGRPYDKLTFIWNGTQKVIDRAPPGFVLPMELIQQGRIDDGIAALLREKELYTEQMEGLEVLLNTAGYIFVHEQKYETAIKIFDLNTKLFPQSANTWDSLGEGYMLAGETALSIENYRKSLALDPGNKNAEKKLRTLMN